MVHEGGLHGVEGPVGCLKALDRRDTSSLGLRRQREATQHALAIDMDGACAALPLVAALLRTGEIGMLAQGIEKRRAGVQP